MTTHSPLRFATVEPVPAGKVRHGPLDGRGLHRVRAAGGHTIDATIASMVASTTAEG